jgi:osmotically-inducible protein OsmY
MIFTDKLPSNSMAIIAEGSSIYLMGILTQHEAGIAKKVASNANGVKDVYAYFDIISEAEKSRLEKQGKADESQPNSAPKQ